MVIKTVALGDHIMVQGTFVKTLENGLIMVRDGEKSFVGKSVSEIRSEKSIGQKSEKKHGSAVSF